MERDDTMARRTTKTTTTKTTTSDDNANMKDDATMADDMNNATTSDDNATTSTTSEDNATSGDDANNPWFAEWPVNIAPIADSKADQKNVAAFLATVQRLSKGKYRATAGATEGDEGSSAQIAANKLVRAMRHVPKDFTYAGIEDEPAAPEARDDNAPVSDPWIDNPAERAELDKLAEAMVAADDEIIAAEVTVREGWRTLGATVLAARTRFASYTTTGNMDNKQWGRWLTAQYMEGGILASHAKRLAKNALSEAADFAGASDDLLAYLPSHLNSPKSFQKWRDDHVRALAAMTAEMLAANKNEQNDADQDGGVEPTPLAATNRELHDALLRKVEMLRKVVAAAQAEAEAAAKAANKDPDAEPVDAATLLKGATVETMAMLAVFDEYRPGLPAVDASDFDDAFAASKLGGALVKRWKAEVEKQAAKKPAGGDDAGGDAGGDTGGDQRTFAQWTVEEAAAHIANMLAARDDAEEVLDAVARVLEARAAKAEEAEAAAAAKAEEAAEQ